MANAKRCDICGEYYQVPDINPEDVDWVEAGRNSSMVRLLRRQDSRKVKHDIFHFDSCEKCFQDVMDYILAKQSSWAEENAE